jgi:frataxin
MSLDENAFEALADQTLQRFMDHIDAVLGDCLDVDLDGGILTIEFDSGDQYVVNKHAPNRQIWMSSPVSGASHFDFDGEAWISSRDPTTFLAGLLAGELAAATGQAFSLD